MEEKNTYKKAFDYSIRLLSLRDYSIHKMKQKLRERKFEADDITTVIEKLLDYNYIREEEFTRIRIKQLIVKGYANKYILQKIQYEKLEATDSDIDEIRDAQDLSSASQMNYLIEKKLRYKEIPTEFEDIMKLKNKITYFLVSKGYQYSEIQGSLNEHLKC